MRRRELISRRVLVFASVAASALASTRAALPQQDRVRRVGFLGANTPAAAGHLATAFSVRLKELGWVEGRNLVIDYRWAGGLTAKFREFAVELIGAGAEVIVTSGDAPVLAAKNASSTVPIVMASSSDPIGSGLIKSLSQPGGNVTGLTFAVEDTVGKRLQLLKQVVPNLLCVAVLFNPDANPRQVAAVRAAAPELGVALDVFEFRTVADLEHIKAFPERARLDALFVISDPLVFVNRVAINGFALSERLPTMHSLQEYADDGGLMSYGPDFIGFFRHAADFVDKILKGARPEDLPVERPTTFRLVVNLKTAKALGLTVPDELLAFADEVIE